MAQRYNNNPRRKTHMQDKDYAEAKDLPSYYDCAPARSRSVSNGKKLPATVEEQLEKLKERGCAVEDEGFAIRTLSNINYFRLAHYFSVFLETKNRYREGTSFNQVLRIYDFDRRLRNLLLEVLEEIEISLRAHCSNFHAIKYGALGYLNADSFSRVHKHQPFISRIQRLVEANKDSDMVKHYIGKHNGDFPLWVAMELFSFGSLNLFYADMKPHDKTEIAEKYYGMTSGELESKMNRLSDLRNHCAHYHRLYDSDIGDPADGSSGGRVFDCILIMKRIYSRPDNWNNGFLRQLKRLYYDYKDIVDLKLLGFEENWVDELTM